MRDGSRMAEAKARHLMPDPCGNASSRSNMWLASGPGSLPGAEFRMTSTISLRIHTSTAHQPDDDRTERIVLFADTLLNLLDDQRMVSVTICWLISSSLIVNPYWSMCRSLAFWRASRCNLRPPPETFRSVLLSSVGVDDLRTKRMHRGPREPGLVTVSIKSLSIW